MSSNDSSSGSAPMGAIARNKIYNAAMGHLGKKMPTSRYIAPDAETLSDGDYNQLEDSLYNARKVQIDDSLSDERERTDQGLSDRGLWSSGLAEQDQRDLTESYQPYYAQAKNEAIAQRYGMEANELNALNQFNMENAARRDDSRWRPADYLAGVWNGTGGTISSGSSSGWSI